MVLFPPLLSPIVTDFWSILLPSVVVYVQSFDDWLCCGVKSSKDFTDFVGAWGCVCNQVYLTVRFTNTNRKNTKHTLLNHHGLSQKKSRGTFKGSRNTSITTMIERQEGHCNIVTKARVCLYTIKKVQDLNNQCTTLFFCVIRYLGFCGLG